VVEAKKEKTYEPGGKRVQRIEKRKKVGGIARISHI